MRPVSDRVQALCAEIAGNLPPGPARDTVAAVGERLAERTLRIAVGGRVNAGKSTLVNALLGQRLAATGATETTTLVTWFRHYHQNRVQLVLKNGESVYVAAAPGGGVPADLPVPTGSIASVVVETANARLADRYNLVDTPGLDSLTGLDDPAMAALAEADALLYVMPHPGERDREALEALRGTSGQAGLSAANVLGVLSRVDTLGDGDDPWPAARRIAARYAGELRGLVADVVPVIGLLAETASGDTFTESDFRLLRRLAALDPDDLEDLLYAPAEFLGADASGAAGLGSADRARLLRLLGVHGLREAAAHLRAGIGRSDELLRALAKSSGIAELNGYVEQNFIRSADRLRASSAVAILERASWLGGDGNSATVLAGLRANLSELKRDPVLRQAALVPALRDLSAGKLKLTDDHARALISLATGNTDAVRLGLPPDAAAGEVAAVAGDWVTRWRRLEGNPSRLTARHARSARELTETAFFANRST
ncbi:50S ribosome-binding GTPase [Actinoplanes sp. LDG1-06]|uniref:50S ribosome-binding GTPase n=1 Tax=Paractinoplanes ovalisporus TaxID=2810368 RepID=A0ABS2ASF7_9ACTN|nr:dynamin family protein [Actinoplanes ovalisporus]MBM2622783.1 50S ribosome-binding GTPase [Actinoplanes ovalisporus]